MVKQRDATGNLIGVNTRVIYGDSTTLARTGTRTVYVERTNLPSRLINGRLVRKTLGYSKQLDMLSASCIWEDVVYNLTRPVKTLRLEVMAATNETPLDITLTRNGSSYYRPYLVNSLGTHGCANTYQLI